MQGYHYIKNIDFSSVAINYMKEKHAALDEMDYQVHDITDPDQSNFVEPGSVNCVIDKATLDSIICSSE